MRMILLWLAAHPLAALAIVFTWTVAWVTGAALWGRAIGRDEAYSEGYEDGLRDAVRQVAPTVAVIPPLPAGPIDQHLATDDFGDPPPRPPTAEADERVAGPATSASLYCAAELNHLLQAIPEDWRHGQKG